MHHHYDELFAITISTVGRLFPRARACKSDCDGHRRNATATAVTVLERREIYVRSKALWVGDI